MSPLWVGVGVLALVGMAASARAGRKATLRAQRVGGQLARAGAMTVTVVLLTAAITGVQWLVVTRTADVSTVLTVLAVPAFLASILVGRLLLVATPVGHGGRSGGGW